MPFPLPASCHRRSVCSAAFVLGLALVLAGCGGEPAVPAAATATPSTPITAAASEETASIAAGSLEAVALELGTVLDADGRVLAAVERVLPGDTVHASLVTVGAAEAAKLVAHWRDGAGVLVAVDERTIRASGPAVHTFSRKPEALWAAGTYEVEVSINGESAGLRQFQVR